MKGLRTVGDLELGLCLIATSVFCAYVAIEGVNTAIYTVNNFIRNAEDFPHVMTGYYLLTLPLVGGALTAVAGLTSGYFGGCFLKDYFNSK
jgi:hypothetical protein